MFGFFQEEGETKQPGRGQLPLRRWGSEGVATKRSQQSAWFDQSAEDSGVKVLSVQVVLTMVLLDLSPHLHHGVSLGAVPQQAHHCLVYASPDKFQSINQ